MTNNLKDQIYNAEAEHEKKLVRLDKDQTILPENKEAIKHYLLDKAAEGVTTVRLNILITSLIRVARLTEKPFNAFNESDAREAIGKLEKREISQWSKNLSKIIFKQLLKRLGRPPTAYDWVKNKRPPNTIQPEDLLTEEEMGRMVAATDNPMWKALLSILFETGIRPGELLTLRIKDVIRNGVKYKLSVAGKLERKQGRRSVYVYRGLPLLEEWLSVHPNKSNAEAPLWISEQKGRPITLQVFGIMYSKISHRARINKRNWPYLARHARLTQFYRDLGSVVGAKLAGHVLGSREIATYTHLSEGDVEKALDTVNGVTQEIKPAEPLKCLRCDYQNPYGKIFCARCSAALGTAGALVHEEENNSLLEEARQFKQIMDNSQIKLLMELIQKPEAIAALKELTKK